MLDNGHTPEEMLAQVLDGLDLEITDTMPAKFYCNCSKSGLRKQSSAWERKRFSP